MASLEPDVRTYYERLGERTRLTAQPSLELLRTKVLLDRYLPEPPARVLDVGGAVGVYAAWLAERGHTVHLVDPVAGQVELASRHGGFSAAVGDARALAEADASQDAVLLLGPLYHLVDRAERVTALREAARVVRPGGVVLAVAINRWAPLCDWYFRRELDQPEYRRLVDSDLDTGTRQDTVHLPFGFTTAYFHRPEELAAEVRAAGLDLADLVAVEGLGHWMVDRSERLTDPEHLARVLDLAARTEREPALLGATAHVMAVGRRVD